MATTHKSAPRRRQVGWGEGSDRITDHSRLGRRSYTNTAQPTASSLATFNRLWPQHPAFSMLSRAAAASAAARQSCARALTTSAPALASTVQRDRFPVTTRETLEHYDIVREIGACHRACGSLKRVTRETQSTRQLYSSPGVVAGGDVRTKNLIKDILAAFVGMFGGETTYYSHLLNESSVRRDRVRAVCGCGSTRLVPPFAGGFSGQASGSRQAYASRCSCRNAIQHSSHHEPSHCRAALCCDGVRDSCGAAAKEPSS